MTIAEWVCNTLGEQADVYYNVIAKTVGAANMRGGGGLENWPSTGFKL